EARTDDGGQPVDGRCDVLLSGTTPEARFWTITLYDPEGRLVANSAQRQGFTSQEIIRNADGSFDIMVGPRARPGNWLPTGGVEKYLLVLRLYDTPIGMAARTGSEAPMPPISKRACLGSGWRYGSWAPSCLRASGTWRRSCCSPAWQLRMPMRACPRSLQSTPSLPFLVRRRRRPSCRSWTRRSRYPCAATTCRAAR